MVRPGEERHFEQIIDYLIEYTKNIRVSLTVFIRRLEIEGDNMQWPQVLDSFTSICGQMNTLLRYARENKSPSIENRVVLPLLLSPDVDKDLETLTEDRVKMVNHEMVPDYLRTKPDPEIEELEKALQAKSNTISPDVASKQIIAMNKLIENTINMIKTNSAKTDSEMSRQAIKPSYNNIDTNELLMAISNGKGLRPMAIHRGLPTSSDSLLGQRTHDQLLQQQLTRNVKAPELKTNIKTGP